MGNIFRWKRGRLSPQDELRRAMSPLRLKATRRQVLRTFGLGAAAIGCSSKPPTSSSEAASQNSGASGPPLGEQQAPPAASVTPSAQQNSPTADEHSNTELVGAQDPPLAQASPSAQDSTSAPAASAEGATATQGSTSAQNATPSATSEPRAQDTTQQQPQLMGRSAFDLVQLGSTDIVTSRLAMGSGTSGYDGSSVQTRLGDTFTRMLVEGYERGVRFYDAADAYGSHFVVADAMQQVGRQNVTLLTKTMAETAEDATADLDRFMEELQTDYLDIVLLHIRTSPTWVQEAEGAMQVLADAKAQGRIRAHGVSCHSLEALQLAAATDWVDINLCRINPFQLHMDADPQTIISVLDSMKSKGQAVVGMKILGQGDAVDRFDEAIEHATRLSCLDGFTIGFRSIEELDQVAEKIASVTVPT